MFYAILFFIFNIFCVSCEYNTPHVKTVLFKESDITKNYDSVLALTKEHHVDLTIPRDYNYFLYDEEPYLPNVGTRLKRTPFIHKKTSKPFHNVHKARPYITTRKTTSNNKDESCTQDDEDEDNDDADEDNDDYEDQGDECETTNKCETTELCETTEQCETTTVDPCDVTESCDSNTQKSAELPLEY